MSTFVDQQLLRLSQPAQLIALVDPPGDVNHARVRALLGAGYSMEFATIHGVSNVQLRHAEFQRPLFPPRRTSGTWTQTSPSYTRADLALERCELTDAVWVDLAAELGLTLLLEIDLGEVESILVNEISGFSTIDEFRNRFRFLDLDAFMAEHRITTVEELREAFQYLRAEIRMRVPGAFNPNDPANQHSYELRLALLVRDAPLDVASALRDAKLARTAAERSLVLRPEVDGGEVRTPYAPVLLFPVTAVPGPPLTQAALEAFFAAEGVLALFI
jgi:hypothetical protein